MQLRRKIVAFHSSGTEHSVDPRDKGVSLEGSIMRSGGLYCFLVFFVAGCMSPVTKRLNTTNEQLTLTNQHLAAINEQIRETNARAIEMNQRLLTTNEQLIETNRRLEAIEKRLPRLPRLGVGELPVPSSEKHPEAE
jgi:septal ring factor EnvC (AmiA/AmiB activator)